MPYVFYTEPFRRNNKWTDPLDLDDNENNSDTYPANNTYDWTRTKTKQVDNWSSCHSIPDKGCGLQ